MSFGATMPSSLYGFVESRTPPASPIGSCVLATQAQPGVGLIAPWRLAYSDALHADFAM